MDSHFPRETLSRAGTNEPWPSPPCAVYASAGALHWSHDVPCRSRNRVPYPLPWLETELAL
jgi:hypothetical protein